MRHKGEERGVNMSRIATGAHFRRRQLSRQADLGNSDMIENDGADAKDSLM
jgi:hypothetical protein